MIAKRAVVRMLLDSHYLDAVVAIGNDSWQHILLKLSICAHLLSVLRHTDVAFVDEEWGSGWLESLLLPCVWFCVPYLCREYLCLLVLHHSLCPSRNTLAVSAVPINVHFIKVAMLHSLSRQFELPVFGALYALCSILVALLPIVEIAYEIDVGSVRSPLAKHPSSTSSFVKSEIFVAISKIRESLLAVVGKLCEFM